MPENNENTNINKKNGLGDNVTSPSNMPETYTNSLYSPGFFRNFIGRLVKAEFLIGNTGLQDRIGILLEVGASYIVLRSVQDNNLLYCDIFSIKFLTISEQSFIYNQNQPFRPQSQLAANQQFISPTLF